VVRDGSTEGIMRVFVAGGSGTIGVPLVRALVAAGHHVTALTRTPEKQEALAALGATPAVADALDATQLRTAVEGARPTHVIHELTALPKDGMVRRASDLAPTNRLRTDGTRNLLDAAIAAGATRFIGGSFAPMQGLRAVDDAEVQHGVAAVESMESQILEASGSGKIEGIVLRYGLFYGPDNPATQKMMSLVRHRLLPVVRGDRSLLPCIHVSDAVSATVAALDRGLPGSVYDIVDDRPISMTEMVRAMAESSAAGPPLTVPAWLTRLFAPFLAGITAMRLPLSNEKARKELDWRLAFPTWRDGLADMTARAA
jgi:nucleoside-diphosphate-sugar epimerase